MDRESSGNYRLSLTVVTAVFIIVRIIAFAFTDNVEGDASVRIYETLRWMDSPHFITHGVWLPMNYYITALFLWLWNDPLISPRIVSLLTGVLTLFPFCALVKSYFGEKAAIISGMIFAFFIPHIVYSVLGLAEAPFIFFVITAFYFLERFFHKKDCDWKLFVSALIFFIFAEMMRIEFWLLIPFFALFIFLKGYKKYSLFFLIGAGAFPAFWMAGCYVATGDLLPLASSNINPENLAYWSTAKKIYVYPYILVKFITPLILLFAITGLIKNLIKKEKYEIGICFLVQFIFLVAITVIGTNAAPKPRYILLASLLLIPYFYDGFYVVYGVIKRKKTLGALTLAAYLATTITVITFGNQTIFPVFKKRSKKIVRWIDKNILPGEKILFAKCAGGDPNIALRAGISWKNADWLLLYPNYLIYSLREIYPYTEKSLAEYILNEKPAYIITSYPRFLSNISRIIRNKDILRELVACKRNKSSKAGYFILQLSYNNIDRDNVKMNTY